MKKTFLNPLRTLLAAATWLVATGVATPVLAQNSAVTSALQSLQDNQLDKAVSSINEATVNEKTKDKAKTWFSRGDIYSRLADPSLALITAKYTKNLKPGEAVQRAAESYQKALALDGATGEFGKQVPARLQGLYNVSFSAGVKSYEAKSYDQAAAGFRLASLVNPKDTTAVLYGAYALDAKKDYVGAKAGYNQLLGMGYKSVGVYTRLILLARQDKNEAETRQAVQQALAAYPTNKTFLVEDLSLSMGAGGPEALAKISKAIEANPTNANYYDVRGTLYDQQKPPQTELADADFLKAVSLDPNTVGAQYNLGVHCFNQGIKLVNKARAMDIKAYNLSGKKVEADGKKLVSEAIPYLEKARLLQPKDPQILGSLQQAYFNVGRTADAERIRAEVDALPK